MANHDELFNEVDIKLNEVAVWFETLSEQEITLNKEGFEAARDATVVLKSSISEAWGNYSELTNPTLEDYEVFRDTVDESVKKNGAIIMANHDISHDAYRGLQVAFKAFLDSLQWLFDGVAETLSDTLEEDIEPYDVTSWFEVEDTTRSLFDKSMEHLVNFFHPKSRGDHDEQHGPKQQHDKDFLGK